MESGETVYESGSSPPKNDDMFNDKHTTPADPSNPTSATSSRDKKPPQDISKRSNDARLLSSAQKHDTSAKDSSFFKSESSSIGKHNQVPHNNSSSYPTPSDSNTSLTSTNSSGRVNINQSRSNNQQVTTSQQNPSFDSNVISERVKNLATQIYQELKKIMARCNYDEEILSGLMPLIVRVLESLDLAIIENQQLQVELELCKDDNEQLVTMFKKEKQAKRGLDKKLIESEYAFEEDRQKYQQKIESLENIVKLLELKAKNASDQAARFEEKDAERKSEYNKLHDRYTELLKSHCDVVERVRHTSSNDNADFTSFMNAPHSMISCNSDLTLSESLANTLTKNKVKSNEADLDKTPVMRREISSSTKSWNANTELTLEDTSLVILDDPAHAGGYPSTNLESSNEISEADHDREGDKDSIAYTSMEKEFRKLIQENKDLLNTKNALNVVKDDLIADVDRLSNEVAMYEQALESVNSAKDQMKQKVACLEAELREAKEEFEKAKQKLRENNEEGVPYSQRKRFGRAEMAKVLMERNNFKERFMELQDAVKYNELVRANRNESEKRSGIWKLLVYVLD